MDYQVYAILQARLDPRAFQSELSQEQFIAAMSASAQQGQAYFFRRGRTVFFIQRATRFVGAVHLWSFDAGFRILETGRSMIEDARQRGLARLEVRTHDRGVVALARRAGFRLEGLRQKSYFTGSGFIDEYELGLLLWGTS